MEKIRATVGLLTYNNERRIARALESVKDFEEIILADGGSTDRTLEIAQRYGARVISQSNPGNPISDFSKERNLLLSAATMPWFIYLDSDEIMSPELVEHVRTVARDAHHPYAAYRVRYLKTNPDGTRSYRTYREYYQIRLTRTDIGARFIRPAHEVLQLPEGTPVGQTEAPWYVPIEAEDLSVRIFAGKAWKRTRATLSEWKPKGLGNVLSKVVVGPASLTTKSLYKMVAVKLKYGRDAIPAKYELLRIVYACMLSIQAVRRAVSYNPHA